MTGTVERGNARSTVTIDVCESQSEVARALEIDASLSASYLTVASMSAKMKFMKSLQLTDRSVTIVVRARHGMGTWTAADVVARENIRVPTNDAQAATFCEVHGDSYIDSVTTGAEYYAVYIFHTETSTEQEELTISVKAKVVGASAEVSAETQTKLTNFLKSTKTSTKFAQEIGGFANPKLPAQDKLIEYALGFTSLPPDAPILIGYTLNGHERVSGFAKTLKGVAKARRYFMGRGDEEGALATLQRLTGLGNQVDWLQKIYATYNYTGDTELNAFEKLVKKDKSALLDQVDEWESDATTVFELPDLASLGKGEPVLEFKAPQPVAFGGKGGNPFDFGLVSDALKRRQRLASIQLWGKSDRVPRMELSYKDEKGTRDVVMGGAYGHQKNRLDIEDGDFPREVVWLAGEVVDFIAILLTKDPGKSTNAGGGTYAQSSWIVPDGHVVLGFGGRAGDYVDQAQIIYAALQPAKFVVN